VLEKLKVSQIQPVTIEEESAVTIEGEGELLVFKATKA